MTAWTLPRVTVEVSEGVVTLRGEASTYFAKRVATDIAWRVGGARGVNNLLEVTNTAGAPDDAELTVNIENVLAWSSHVDSSRIIVSVDRGVVTLEGDVDSYWKYKRAEDLVSELSGVIAVENKLAVVPTKDFDDETIAVLPPVRARRSRHGGARFATTLGAIAQRSSRGRSATGEAVGRKESACP